jgi:hypothetical protein
MLENNIYEEKFGEPPFLPEKNENFLKLIFLDQRK